jgi:hypothetical protein|tara:strand:+ start:1830 stop:2045 length:216 start_codon:yes stop_codon:yes gene_type:complete
MSTDKDLYAMLVKLDERQKTLFNMMIKVEKHLEKLNGKVDSHEVTMAQLKVYGTIAIVTFPVIVNVIMEIL